MAKTNTMQLKMINNGNTYQIDPVKYESLESLFIYAKESMKHPCMYHFLSHIEDPEQFRKSKRYLIRLFERALKRQYKKGSKENTKRKTARKQVVPDVLVAYSIEYKLTSQKEIDGDSDAYKYGHDRTKEKLPFLHIHFYVIADCKLANAAWFPDMGRLSLNQIKGLRAGRYFRSSKGELYKSLKTDYDDAFSKILYIGKTEQKSPEIPYRKAFDTSEIKKLTVTG